MDMEGDPEGGVVGGSINEEEVKELPVIVKLKPGVCPSRPPNRTVVGLMKKKRLKISSLLFRRQKSQHKKLRCALEKRISLAGLKSDGGEGFENSSKIKKGTRKRKAAAFVKKEEVIYGGEKDKKVEVDKNNDDLVFDDDGHLEEEESDGEEVESEEEEESDGEEVESEEEEESDGEEVESEEEEERDGEEVESEEEEERDGEEVESEEEEETPPKRRKRRNVVSNRVKCPQCCKDVRECDLDTHLWTYHKIGTPMVFRCEECGREFRQKHNLISHKRVVHQGIKYTQKWKGKAHPGLKKMVMCEECGKVYSSVSINAHKRNVHGKNKGQYACIDCGKAFKLKANLELHVKKEHVEGWDGGKRQRVRKSCSKGVTVDLECPHCGKVFSDSCYEAMARLKLERHIFFTHGEGTDPDNHVACTEPGCGKRFKRKDTMMDHVRRYHKGVNFKCDICGRDLQSAGKLWKHKVDTHGMHHLEPPGNVIQCEHCHEKIMRGYEAHMRKNHPGKELNMELLMKSKGTSANLEQRDKAWGVRMECPECGRKVRRDYLKRHIETLHGGKGWGDRRKSSTNPKIETPEVEGKKIQCEECSWKFPDQEALDKHVVKKHQFKNFDSLIEAKQLLVTHWKLVRNRRGESFFSCAICSQMLTLKLEMHVHLANMHPDINEVLKRDGEDARILIGCEFCPWVDELMEKGKNLREHLEQEHSLDCWRCPQCNKVMISPTEIELHFKTDHGEEGEEKGITEDLNGGGNRRRMNFELGRICYRCQQEFESPQDVVAHVEVAHPEAYWPCELCGRIEYSEPGLHLHLNQLCPSKRRPKDASYKQADRKESRSDKGYDQFLISCVICTKKVRLYTLRSHFREYHGVKEDSWLCDKCGKQFAQRLYWIHHMDHYHAVPSEEIVEMAKQLNVSDMSNVEIRQKEKYVPKGERKDAEEESDAKPVKHRRGRLAKKKTPKVDKLKIKKKGGRRRRSWSPSPSPEEKSDKNDSQEDDIPKHSYGTRRRGRGRGGGVDAKAIAEGLGVTLKSCEIRVVRLTQTEIDRWVVPAGDQGVGVQPEV